MFCGNCGRQFKDNESFCTYCGKEKVIPTVKVDINNMSLETGKKTNVNYKSCSSTILLGFFGFFFLAFMWGNAYLRVVNSQEYEFDYTQKYSNVKVGDIFVPTLSNLIFEYKLCSDVDDDFEGKAVYYCDEKLTNAVLNKYLNALIDEYGYKEDKNSNSVRSVIFVDEKYPGYTVVVEVDYSKKVIYYYKYDNEIIDEEMIGEDVNELQ